MRNNDKNILSVCCLSGDLGYPIFVERRKEFYFREEFKLRFLKGNIKLIKDIINKMNNIIITPCGFKYIKDNHDKEKPYLSLTNYKYYSKRYNKHVVITIGCRSDGATGALDIPSLSWWIHDKLCENGCWNDGVPLTNYQCSQVLFDILWSEKRYFRCFRWKYATFLLGGGKARKNGMFKLKKEMFS